MRRSCLLLVVTALAALTSLRGQEVIFGKDLLVNGDAEASPVSSIRGWSVLSGAPRVVTYSSGEFLTVNDNGPENRGANYFAGGPQTYPDGIAAPATLGQLIDISPAASSIDAGDVAFEVTCYLGGPAGVRLDFLNATGALADYSECNGTTWNVPAPSGLYFGRTIGRIRSGVRAVSVTLQMQGNGAAGNILAFADNLSFVLTLPPDPQTLFGRNLVVNGTAETGSPGTATAFARDVPGWVRSATFSIDSYSDTGGILKPSDPGPADRGQAYFWGGSGSGSAQAKAHQDIDLSAAATMIDSGNVSYTLSASLGGVGTKADYATVESSFGAVVGPVLESDRNGVTGLFARSQTGIVPAGTRIAGVTIDFERREGDQNDAVADNVSLVLTYNAPPTQPSIRYVGAPLDFLFGHLAPGSWIEIYGDRLSSSTAQWQDSDFQNGVAPTSLARVTVTVNDKPAFISYASPGQINALLDSRTGTGPSTVIVSNEGGISAPFPTMTDDLVPLLLAPQSFRLDAGRYVVALLADGSYVLPTGSIAGVQSRPAKPGETIVLYGIGFGPVTPAIDAGTLVTQKNSLVNSPWITFAGIPGTVTYAGLTVGFTGLYQLNVIVPDVPDSDSVPVKFSVGGVVDDSALFTAIRR